MTKEELEKEAEDVVSGMRYDTYESDGHSDFIVQDILVKFAEPREKRIAELETQIEKMKCCENCNNTWNGYHLNVCDDCKNRDKWEIKEK